MANQKPCDIKKRRGNLPCLDSAKDLCLGHLCWVKENSVRGRKTATMVECPWENKVEAWLKKKGYM